jgi:4-diphosphocytidyl-2-C-methyl-D-erythritol kinase
MTPAIKRIALRAYAKINLGLSILGRREDGYHELRTVFQTVSLADDVEIELGRSSGPVRLKCSGFDVPEGAANLAVRAAELVRRERSLRRGVLIRLRKRIPPGSGLGGASSDAAAVLRGLLALSGTRLPGERLLRLAATLGSDVPFFLIGGRAVGLGRGEELYPLPEAPRRWAIILFPGEGMSTVEAYRLLRRPRLTANLARPTIELFCGRVLEEVVAGAALTNDFEPLLLRRLPVLRAARRALLQSGAETAALSGSGSAFYGLFADGGSARRAADALKKLLHGDVGGVDAGGVFVARTISRREFAREAGVYPSRK